MSDNDWIDTASRAMMAPRAPLELWGGVECTVNRVRGRFFDQLEWSGHARRVEDLDRFAELGLKRLRVPMLWERIAPNGIRSADWTWPDSRLAALRSLEIDPIVGLVHHGSGIRSTSIVHESYASGLAAYARAFAERYPWITAYTPVNEPVATARFSTLYRHWFPHGDDDRLFARALLVQARAIALAMRAIRHVQPAAQLIQTEDIGRTFSTPRLRYQANLENERRWLVFDLLSGRVAPGHPLWEYLQSIGADRGVLEWFVENPCNPDIVGVNYYVTSDRFLDHRLARYPAAVRGGNRQEVYADVEAVRVCTHGIWGIRNALTEAWDRYRAPVAVTEVHLGCTREEQLRWLAEIWDGAIHSRSDGVDVRAVTVWALLGTFNWNSLVTRDDGYYEPGVFDVQSREQPRPTAIAGLVRELARGAHPTHPVLSVPGWWRRPERLLYPSVKVNGPCPGVVPRSVDREDTPLALIGAGLLASMLRGACRDRGLAYTAAPNAEAALAHVRPWAMVLAVDDQWTAASSAGITRRDAEQLISLVSRAARACTAAGIPLVLYTTPANDAVLGGAHRVAVSGLVSRRNSEHMIDTVEAIVSSVPRSLTLRTGFRFDAGSTAGLVASAVSAKASRDRISLTRVRDAIRAGLDLVIDAEVGEWHLVNDPPVTAAELLEIANCYAMAGPADPPATPPAPWSAHRALTKGRRIRLPSLESALAACADEEAGNPPQSSRAPKAIKASRCASVTPRRPAMRVPS